MEGKVKSYDLGVRDFPWGCFSRVNKDGVLISINGVVPVPVDENTFCVSVHEYMHAFEMYQQLGMVYVQYANRIEAHTHYNTWKQISLFPFLVLLLQI